MMVIYPTNNYEPQIWMVSASYHAWNNDASSVVNRVRTCFQHTEAIPGNNMGLTSTIALFTLNSGFKLV